MTAIGSLRTRLTVQQRSSTTDVGPVKTVAWSTLAAVWAEVVPVQGIEQRQVGAAIATTTYRVRIRYRTDVTPAHRIVWGSVTLQVNAAYDPDGRRQYLELRCSAVA